MLPSSLREIIWIDILSFESAFKLIQMVSEKKEVSIYYANTTKLFRFFIPYLEKCIGRPVEQIKSIDHGVEKVGNISLFEYIQQRMSVVAEDILNSNKVSSFVSEFCQKYKYNKIKFKAHIRETLLCYTYRPLELFSYGEMLAHSKSVYLLRCSPVSWYWLNLKGKDSVFYYQNFLSSFLSLEIRKDYAYESCYATYCQSRFAIVLSFLGQWFLDALAGLFNFAKVNKIHSNHDCAVGVELSQGKQRKNEINDVYWIKEAGLMNTQFYGITTINYDLKSADFIRSSGLENIILVKNPVSILLTFLKSRGKFLIGKPLFFDKFYFLKTVRSAFYTFLCIFYWNRWGWFVFHKYRYHIRTCFWQNIFTDLNIRIFWSMYDVDEDKLAKSQALENLGGFYTGSHWSNVSLPQEDCVKCSDVFFPWGAHFRNNIFTLFPPMISLDIGYPLDYYFERYREDSTELRKDYFGKFIICFQDNAMYNDLPYGKNIQHKIYTMFLSILKLCPSVVLVLKPKRKQSVDIIFQIIPELNDLIQAGRVKVFFGEEHHTKAVPAKIAMASDLVVGLGISTAATESFLSGTISYHIDLVGFNNNDFVKNGLGKVVFNNLEDLYAAILKRIDGIDPMCFKDYQTYYRSSDPYQDGESYKRMAFAIRRIKDNLDNGLSREETIKALKVDYEKFISLKYPVENLV